MLPCFLQCIELSYSNNIPILPHSILSILIFASFFPGQIMQELSEHSSKYYFIRSLCIAFCCVFIIAISIFEINDAISNSQKKQEIVLPPTYQNIRNKITQIKLSPEFPQKLYMPQPIKLNHLTYLGHTLIRQDLFPTTISNNHVYQDQILFFDDQKQLHAYLKLNNMQQTYKLTDVVTIARKVSP